ncbi:signal-transduction protein [Mycobacterium xenopi RIVM700367]|nr:signal-transduction protein [Mycobacterium xenopi RIVM700367]
MLQRNTCATFDVGALPIRGDDGQLRGMITDRDVVIKCVAQGLDPTTTVRQMAQGGV